MWSVWGVECVKYDVRKSKSNRCSKINIWSLRARKKSLNSVETWKSTRYTRYTHGFLLLWWGGKFDDIKMKRAQLGGTVATCERWNENIERYCLFSYENNRQWNIYKLDFFACILLPFRLVFACRTIFFIDSAASPADDDDNDDVNERKKKWIVHEVNNKK